MPCDCATVCWFDRSSWLFAIATWCHAVLIIPVPGKSSTFEYAVRVASSAALNTTAKSVSYSECFAELTSFLLWQAASPTTATKKMIRSSRCMGGRPRNSTPKPTRGAGKVTPQSTAAIAALLAQRWPDAVVELDHRNPYELLVATILSAQSTDKMINTITPALFAKYPDATALSRATPEELEPMIFKSGFYRNKAKSLLGMAVSYTH